MWVQHDIKGMCIETNIKTFGRRVCPQISYKQVIEPRPGANGGRRPPPSATPPAQPGARGDGCVNGGEGEGGRAGRVASSEGGQATAGAEPHQRGSLLRVFIIGRLPRIPESIYSPVYREWAQN